MSEHHDTEDQLRAALEHRAEQTTYSATPGSRVVLAANRIRRRRRAAVSSLAAAAVAAAIVVPLVALNRPEATGPSPAPAPTSTADPNRPDVSPTKAAEAKDYRPRIGYLAGSTYTGSGGETVEIPAGDPVVGVNVLDDTDPMTLVVTRDPGNGEPLEWSYIVSGSAGETFCTTGVPVTDSGGGTVYATTRACAPSASTEEFLTLLSGPDSEPLTQSVPSGSAVVASQGNAVALNASDAQVYIALLSPDLRETEALSPVPGVASASDVNTARFEAGAVSGVLDNGAAAVVTFDGQVAWQRQGIKPKTFSPRGNLLLTERAGAFEVVTARKGNLRVTLGPGLAPDRLTSLAWDGDRHLLGVRSDDSGNQSLVRLGLDGSVTPLSGAELDPDDRFVFDDGPPPYGDGPIPLDSCNPLETPCNS